MNNPHIIQDFDDALRSLKSEVLAMASQTTQNLEQAVCAVVNRDADLARAVIADDTLVDEAEMEIDRMGLALLTRFHPVASDLRFVLASMKASTNLERISDHAVNIAKRARKMQGRPELPETRQIEPIHELAAALLRDSLESFLDGNESLAKSLGARDKELDRLHKSTTAAFSRRIEEGDSRSEDFLHLILVARSLERVGDLAVNIGEDAVFMESSEDIRHGGGA